MSIPPICPFSAFSATSPLRLFAPTSPLPPLSHYLVVHLRLSVCALLLLKLLFVPEHSGREPTACRLEDSPLRWCPGLSSSSCLWFLLKRMWTTLRSQNKSPLFLSLLTLVPPSGMFFLSAQQIKSLTTFGSH